MRNQMFCVVLLLCCAALARPVHAQVAQTPIMGWNSYDSNGAFVTEAEVVQEANYMAANLKQFGYNYIVVDYDWAWTQPQQGAVGSGTTGNAYIQQTDTTTNGVTTASPPLAMNAYGQLQPDPTRFPGGTVNGVYYANGMAYLGAYIHSLGLDFGIHIMRGIPQQAVFANDPVAGAPGVTADQIADTGSSAPWLDQMYGLDAGTNGQLTPNAQAYYNSLFDMYASWGVDFIKADDMLNPTYHSADVVGIQTAIAQSGRPMVLSLSPGAAPVNQATQLAQNSNMWRILADVSDDWNEISPAFAAAAAWEQYAGPGHWPDADMLPLGNFINPPTGNARTTSLSHDQQQTVMTLWCIIHSPLIMGGDLPSLATDPWTTSLLTNPAILAVDQASMNNHQLFDANNQIAWEADVPNSYNKYVAMFDTDGFGGTVTVPFASLGLSPTGTYDVINLWTGANLGNFTGSVSATLNSDASVMYEVINTTAVAAPAWNVNSSGDWNNPANWSANGVVGAVPDAAGDEADFLNVITSPHTVFTDIAVTVGTLNFNSPQTYQITGAGSLTLRALTGQAQVIVQQGVQEINLPLTIASNTSFTVANGATLIIANPMTVNSDITLTENGNVVYQSIINLLSGASINVSGQAMATAVAVSSGANVTLAPGTGATLTVTSLQLNGANLNLNNGKLVINYGTSASPIAQVKAEIAAAYDQGKWDGTGITSTSAAVNPNYALGYSDGSIDPQSAATAGQILVEYTLYGDTNLDGSVNFTDLLKVAADYNTTGNDWSGGDFNYDPTGAVDFADLLLMAQNDQTPLTPQQQAQLSPSFVEQWDLAQAQTAVPEPVVGWIAAAAVIAGSRRRGRRPCLKIMC